MTKKFELVSKANEKGVKLNYLLNIANVSKSGYFYWQNHSKYKELKDKPIVDIVEKICASKRYKIGIRSISMILRNKYNLTVNHKKIERIKREYKIPTNIRKKNKYNIFAKKSLEHRTASNLLKQNFKSITPDSIYSTDISYLPYYGGKRAYLSATKDLATKEIVAFDVISNLEVMSVFDNLQKVLLSKNPNDLTIHSDQGFHYTHPYYIKMLKNCGVTQSMSRKGNCLDNAPIESFFGHMKDEIELKTCKTFEDVKIMIENYINYYNNERCQWNLKKMTPAKYRCHLCES